MAPPAAIDVLPESDTSTFTVPDRLTIQGVAKRRAVEGRLIAGVAAVADIERFKGRTVHAHKAKARRWDRKYPFGSFVRIERTNGLMYTLLKVNANCDGLFRSIQPGIKQKET